MKRKLALFPGLLMSLAMLVSPTTAADCCDAGCASPGCSDIGCCDSGCGGHVTCPQCSSCCELKVEDGKEEKHCWKIECTEICVPKVVFPWQKSCCDPCANNGACVKTVKKLKKHTYECPVCEYKWTPKKNTCGCGTGCCDVGCTDVGCADSGCCDAGCTTAAPIDGTFYPAVPVEGPVPTAAPVPAEAPSLSPANDVPAPPPSPSAQTKPNKQNRLAGFRKLLPSAIRSK